jgi:hypothetical protein
LLKSKSKVSSRLPTSRKLASLTRTFEEAVLAAEQFVLHEPGEEIDGGQLLGLGFKQAGFEAGGDAGAAELAQGALEFEDVHELASWALRAMTSR